jgi:gamma-glutamyltranspeptidase/glutathione hydrolase
MVVAPHHLAARAGLEILREGGNAVEAVVAAAATLCVVYPHMTGLGGDGFWLIHLPGRDPAVIDACGRSAALAIPELYLSDKIASIPHRGPLAALTVPGAVSGWRAALDLVSGEGRPLPLSRLFDEAVFLARDGFAVTAHQAGLTRSKFDGLSGQPGFADQFLPGGKPPEEGSRMRLPALADTFERLAREGLDGFYRGDVARDLAADLYQAGSPLRFEDLAAQRAALREPLRIRLPGAEAFNLPAPTQGMASLMLLGVFARLGVEKAEGFDHVHGLLEACKRAFAARDRIVGDPDLMEDDPRAHLTDEVLSWHARAIDSKRAAPWPSRFANAGDTVWLGAADREGRVVSAIQSIFFEYGSGVVLPGTGVTMQNRGIAFDLRGNGPRLLGPGRKPYHTLNPAMARFADGRVMAYGTMGGEGQPQTQAQFITRHALFGQGIQAALTAPRFVQGRTWGSDSAELLLEDRFDPALVEALRKAGHEVKLVGAFDAVMGHAGAVAHRADGTFEGGADPRGDGAAACF